MYSGDYVAPPHTEAGDEGNSLAMKEWQGLENTQAAENQSKPASPRQATSKPGIPSTTASKYVTTKMRLQVQLANREQSIRKENGSKPGYWLAELVSIIPATRFSDMKFESKLAAVYAEQCVVTSNENVYQDYIPVFISHVHPYVLGDLYDIRELKILALSKLHSTLKMYTRYESRYEDVVELIRYTYEMTVTRVRIDEMQELVVKHVAQAAPEVSQSTECLSLI